MLRGMAKKQILRKRGKKVAVKGRGRKSGGTGRGGKQQQTGGERGGGKHNNCPIGGTGRKRGFVVGKKGGNCPTKGKWLEIMPNTHSM